MSLNIGGDESDVHFRYKMPELATKIEGRGNGIKTVITNMADVGSALKRDPAYPTKFFANELGALSQWDDKRNVGIVNGEHSKATLQKLLEDFIKRYVLCPNCKLPETDLKVKNKQIMAKCKACGHRGPSDNIHKVATYIINHPPKGSKDKDKDSKEKDKTDKSKKDKKDKKDKDKEKTKTDKPRKTTKSENSADTNNVDNADDNDDDNDDDDDSNDNDDENNNSDEQKAEPVVEQKPKKKGKGEKEEVGMQFEITEDMSNVRSSSADVELADPVQEVIDLMEKCSTEALDSKFEKLCAHQQLHGYERAEFFKFVFKALITDGLAKQLKTSLPLLKKLLVSGRDDQWMILSLLEERCEEYNQNLKDIPAALMTLYDEELLEEEIILTWYEKGVSQLLALADDATSRDTRKAADKFVEWLKNAEEESEEDDDE